MGSSTNRALKAKAERAKRQAREFGRVEGMKTFYHANDGLKDVPTYWGKDGRYVPIRRFGEGEATTADGEMFAREKFKGISSVGKFRRQFPGERKLVEHHMVEEYNPRKPRYHATKKDFRLGAALSYTRDAAPRLIRNGEVVK